MVHGVTCISDFTVLWNEYIYIYVYVIPQYTIQNKYVQISALNGALRDTREVY